MHRSIFSVKPYKCSYYVAGFGWNFVHSSLAYDDAGVCILRWV